MHRYAQGGDPVPEALDSLVEFLSNRQELPSEQWVFGVLSSTSVSREIAVFAYDFFASFHIPIGKIRCGDRVKGDLHFNEALQDDWDEELVDEFKRRFGKNIAFTRWPPIATLGDLLLFLQGNITERGPLAPAK
jgi:hypothetical protein